MDVSALRYPAATGRYGRSPLLKLQSDERLVAMVRRGNQGAFEVLVARYHARLLSFCRHMVGSREDAEDVLQDVLTASYNAMLADDRAINVRPWLYRIARNRCLNHLRRNRAVGVDSMDIHFAEHGASTADKVHDREEFRQLLHDIRDLPETQRTALVLREMDALSYEQIAEAMETTVSSVKSLLVRARVSLTEAAEARLLTCEEVREELAEIAEGLRRKQSPSVRRHVKNCARCEVFQGEMRKSSRALAALTPIGPLAFFHKLLFAHAAAHTASSAGAGVAGAAGAGGAGGAGAAGAGAAGAGAAGAAAGGAGSAGLVTAGVGAVATKAAAGIAAAALVTAGTVAIDHGNHHKHVGPSASTLISRSLSSGLQAAVGGSTRLGGAVGAGPGLSVVVPAAAAKVAHMNKAVHATPAVGSTPPNGSQGTPKVTAATKVVKTDANAGTQPTTSQPPAPTVVSSSTVTPTGGAGLSTTPSTTSSGASAVLTSTTATPTTAPVGTTTTSTPTTGTTTVTTTTPTGTTTGTNTSPTGTNTSPTGTPTTPTGTPTTPTGTPTTPGDTPTTPVTDTNPSDTTAGADTTTTPVEP
jgi:RNA polymerase sigma factor (sigma-70 family)